MRCRPLLSIAFFIGFLGMALVGWASSKATNGLESGPIKRSSSAIAISADGSTVLAVNPDSDSISFIDTAGQILLAEVAVGIDPRTVVVDDVHGRVYVANRGSDSISVLDLASRQLLRELAVGNRPYGLMVSPDGQRLYVAEQGSNRLAVLDTENNQIIDRVAVDERPSGLAISQDGQRLYITYLLSNTITILPTHQLGQLRYKSYLPLAVSRPTAAITPGSRALTASSVQSPASTYRASIPPITLWPDSNLVQSMIIGPDGQIAYVPHTRSNTGNRNLTFDSTVFPLVSLVDLTSGKHLVGQQINLGTLDPPGVGLPFDAAVTADGGELWVVNAASNDISVVDLPNRRLAAHIEVGDNPRGIVLSPDGATAYANNSLAGTVSVIDTSTYSVTQSIPTTQIPLPPLLLQGKRLFHSSDDLRLSNAQWIACSSCHFDGEQDGRTWFFSFAGPRNTTSLLGMVETYPLRWSGEWNESADGEFAIRKENFGLGLIDGVMHCTLTPVDCVNQPPNQGRSEALDALAAFMDSLMIPLSPNHARGEGLTVVERRGQALFDDPALGCSTCHPAPLYTDQQKHDVGTSTADERIGPAFDTPSLRGLYDSAPYFHDGSAATLREAITRPSPGGEHDVQALLSEDELQALIAFLLALPFE